MRTQFDRRPALRGIACLLLTSLIQIACSGGSDDEETVTPSDAADIRVNTVTPRFAECPLGSTCTLQFRIFNDGDGQLLVSDIESFGEFGVEGFTDVLAVEPDGSDEVTLTFTPQAPCTRHGDIIISTNDPDAGSVLLEPSGIGEQCEPTLFPIEGSSGTQVVIDGAGFSANSMVSFGGRSTETIAVSTGQLLTFVPFELTDSTASPLSPGQVAVTVDGVEIGTFTVLALPANPNAPGVVWDTATIGLADELPAIRAQIDARIAEILPAAGHPILRDLLNAASEALPALEAEILGFAAQRSRLSPEALDLVERLLLREGVAPAGVQQSQGGSTIGASLDPACASGTVMDQMLCNRQRHGQRAKLLDLLGITCAGVAAIVSATNPAAGASISTGCTASGVLTGLDKFLNRVEIVGVEVVGPAELRTGESDLYRAEVTLRNRRSLAVIDTLLVALIGEIGGDLGPIVTGPAIEFLLESMQRATGLTFPDIPTGLTPREQRAASAENFGWSIDPELSYVDVDATGTVTVGDVPFVSPTIKLSADLEVAFWTPDDFKREFKEEKERERNGVDDCASRVIGCKDIELIPNILLAVGVGTGGGRVTSLPAGIDCPDTCLAQFKEGTVVELLARPDLGFVFVGWSDACSGSGECKLTMQGARVLAVTAIFSRAESFVGTMTIQGQPFDRGACRIQHQVQLDLLFILATDDQAGSVQGTVAAPVNYFELVLAGMLEECTVFGQLFGSVGSGPAGTFTISAPADDITFQESGMVTDLELQNPRALTVGFEGAHLDDAITGTAMVRIEGIGSFELPITAERLE